MFDAQYKGPNLTEQKKKKKKKKTPNQPKRQNPIQNTNTRSPQSSNGKSKT